MTRMSVPNRLSAEDATELLAAGDLHALGERADRVRRRIHRKNVVTFVIDRNINITNVCVNRCRFCAFYRDIDDPSAYVLTREEIFEKIKETLDLGGTQILIQGGLHPKLTLRFYTELFSAIRERYPIHIHGLSAPEIYYLSRRSGLSVARTLVRLRDAGLGSIPGAGAEILSDRIRKRISPNKIRTRSWLYVMEQAHALGIRTTATMMFGTGEQPAEIVEHLKAVRDLQDRTGGFTAFIPWTFQPENTEICVPKATATDYLRVLALSRIFLDNIPNIQASWVTQGLRIAQLSLRYGANDMGSTMIEENVVAAAGVHYRVSVEELVGAIKEAGFRAAQRTTFYKIARQF